MGSIGPMEIIIVMVAALLIFGPKKLPEMGRSLGKGMREFKDTISGQERDANGLDPHQAAALARYEAERARAGNEEVVAGDTD